MRKSILAVSILLCVTTNLARGQQPAAPPLPTAGPVYSDIAYEAVGGKTLLLDVYEPAGMKAGPRPAIILIHGVFGAIEASQVCLVFRSSEDHDLRGAGRVRPCTTGPGSSGSGNLCRVSSSSGTAGSQTH